MRFLNFLNRFLQYPGRGRTTRRPEKSPSRLSLETLEDRLVPASATLNASTLTIKMDPGTPTAEQSLLMEVDAKDHTKIDVSENGVLLGRFPIASISKVNVTVAGNDVVKVDDSNGFPFAPGTLVSLSGSGANNSLALIGSQAANGNETFNGGTATSPGSLGVDSVLFEFNGAVGAVTDDLTANQLVVQTQGQEVSLVGANGATETLKGLAGGVGGGNTLTFRGKSSVVLDLESPNAVATLNASAAALDLTDFQVNVFGKTDKVDIKTTPNGVNTHVEITGGQDDTVQLEGNLGPVSINGDSTTVVLLETNGVDSSKSVTAGIKNNVFVEGSEALEVLDGGNVSTRENMRVTESTLSGSGMFGSNSVVVTYQDTELLIETGRLANTYTIAGSHPGAEFLPQGISLNDDFSSAGMTVRVDVDSASGLALGMFNLNPAAGSLSISAAGGTFNPASPTTPDGSEVVSFAGGVNSRVNYEGFANVALS